MTRWTWPASTRDWSFAQNLTGTAGDATWYYTVNPAMQTRGRTLTNGAAYGDATPPGTVEYAPDGLNRYGSVGGVAFTYDARGNLTSDGAWGYVYDTENRLLSATGAKNAVFAYDPLGRLATVTAAGLTEVFVYDGDDLIDVYRPNGTLIGRYGHGSGADEAVVWFDRVGGAPQGYYADERGSIIGSGEVTPAKYAYDPYGQRAPGNASRFAYTGQTWLGAVGLYYYKARIYDPITGRFLQTDPIGYEDSLNLYAYVGNDPMNRTDPTGLAARSTSSETSDAEPWWKKVLQVCFFLCELEGTVGRRTPEAGDIPETRAPAPDPADRRPRSNDAEAGSNPPRGTRPSRPGSRPPPVTVTPPPPRPATPAPRAPRTAPAPRSSPRVPTPPLLAALLMGDTILNEALDLLEGDQESDWDEDD